MMLWKNRNRKVGLCMMGVTAMVMAVLWTVLTTPETTMAGKGNGGRVGGDVSGWIFSKVTFDSGGAVESDGNGEYIDGVDRTEMRIGRNFNIIMDFNTHNKKESIRKLKFTIGPLTEVFPGPCYPSLSDNRVITERTPGIAEPTIADLADDAKLEIYGQDHDDSMLNCKRYVNARFTIKDDNGQNWYIYFGRRQWANGSYYSPCGSCVIVTRLHNLDSDDPGVEPDYPGIAQWKFSTEDDGNGNSIGYVYRDNNPPHAPTEFWGTINLPFSGIIESLTDEPKGTECLDSDIPAYPS